MRPIAFIVAVLLAAGSAFASVDRLVIHEWGTFTSLQDEDGRSIGAINSDDERLPPFVHDLIQSEFQYYKGGVPDSFPSVTMRLETPVLYIHPAPGMKVPPLDVTVHFRGGLLTQFYPLAAASRPRFTNAQLDPITADTDGRLAWAHLTVGGDAAGPATDAHVWTAPRDVAGIANFSANGESEKFLFYRGVGHLDAPVRVVRHSNLLMFQNQVEFPLV
ncbi:MAG TPA: hypothetical protein VLI90_09120, partial [Tepidisphaeraceae bacterium]|nr:hypothetical protein [Tepidisphaeraceae bacterium]